MTTNQLALSLGVHPKTVRRRIARDISFYHDLAGGPFPFGAGDTLPEAVVLHLSEQGPGQSREPSKGGQPPGGAPMSPPARPVPPLPAPGHGDTPAKPGTREDSLKARNKQAHDLLFSNTSVVIAAAAVLILVDAVSFGWIAWNTYPAFARVAVPIFALAGMATGYSAFKSILAYRGWNGDGWMMGFGLFQLALHLCAMQALGEWSFIIGKVVISVGLPLASAGLALALKNGQQND